MCGGCRPPHDPASAFRHVGPRSSCSRTCRRDAVLAGFRFERTSRDEARVAGVRPERWNRIRRSRCFLPGLALRRASGFFRTWRRLDGLLLAMPYVFDRRARVRPGKPAPHASPTVQPLERLRYPSVRSSPGHSPVAPFSRGVPLPVRPQRGLVGATQVFPRSPPDGAHGVQDALRRFDPADRWTVSRVASDAAKSNRGSSRDPLAFGISAGPGPRVVCRLSSAPIYFRRGDRSPVGENQICKSDRPGMSVAFDFWASLPSAVRFRGTSRPRKRSCLGLCLLQGCRALDRASGRARPRFRITSLRNIARRTH